MAISKKQKGTYYLFNQHGECQLPSKREIEITRSKNINPVIFLDTNVCLNIAKVVDYGKSAANCNRDKVFHLKEYLSKSGADFNEVFGLIELCLRDGILDYKKMIDFKHRIDFFKQIPFKVLKRFEFNFHRDYRVNSAATIPEDYPIFDSIKPLLFCSYCALLKMRSLASKGLSKRHAEDNINEFLYWMRNKLGIILGIEFNLAMKIFGGLTEYRKMIWLDGKLTNIKQRLWGTAWDINHSRLCTDSRGWSKNLGEDIDSYFLTNDYTLFKLLSQYSLSGILDSENNGVTTVHNADFDLPHLDDEFLSMHTSRMINLMYLSTKKNKDVDVDKVSIEIKTLEKENGIENNMV